MAAAPLSTAQKSGQTWSLLLDASGAAQALYVYSSASTAASGYIAKIALDGSYTVGNTTYGPNGVQGGSVSNTGVNISANNLSITGTSTFAPNGTSVVAVTINGIAGQTADLFEVYSAPSGTKYVWVDSSGSLRTINPIYVGPASSFSNITADATGIALVAYSSGKIYFQNGATGILGSINNNKILNADGGFTAGSSTYGPTSASIAGNITFAGNLQSTNALVLNTVAGAGQPVYVNYSSNATGGLCVFDGGTANASTLTNNKLTLGTSGATGAIDFGATFAGVFNVNNRWVVSSTGQGNNAAITAGGGDILVYRAASTGAVYFGSNVSQSLDFGITNSGAFTLIGGQLITSGAKVNVVGGGGINQTLELYDTTNGAVTPAKYFRVAGGSLQICNSAFTYVPWQMTDGGAVSQCGALTIQSANLYMNGAPTPSAPTLSQTAGGTAASGTFVAKVTWNTSFGESSVSAEASFTVSANNQLVVTPPAAPVGISSITSWNVYVGTSSGNETKQASNLTLGAAWTMPTSGLISGAALPVFDSSSGSLKFGPNNMFLSVNTLNKVAGTSAATADFTFGNAGSLNSQNPFWNGYHFSTTDVIINGSSQNTFPRGSLFNSYTSTSNPNDLYFNIQTGNATSIAYGIQLTTSNNGHIVLNTGSGDVMLGSSTSSLAFYWPGTNISAPKAINFPTTFSSGSVTSYLGTDAATSVATVSGQFLSLEASNGAKFLTVDASGNLGNNGSVYTNGDFISYHNIYGNGGPATFTISNRSAAALGWNGSGAGEATIYSAFTNPGYALSLFWYNGSSYQLAAKIKTDGTYYAGSSTYGPTSAVINGSLTLGTVSSATLQAGAQLLLGTDGTYTYLRDPNQTGTGGAIQFGNQSNSLAYGQVNTNGYVVGSSTYGPTSATVNGLLTATTVNVSGTNYLQLGGYNFATQDGLGNGYFQTPGGTGAIYFRNNALTANNIHIPDSGGLVIDRGSISAGNSTYGPTGATINGTLNTGSIVFPSGGYGIGFSGTNNGSLFFYTNGMSNAYTAWIDGTGALWSKGGLHIEAGGGPDTTYPFIGNDGSGSNGVNLTIPTASTLGWRFFTYDGSFHQQFQIDPSGNTTSAGWMQSGNGFNAGNTTGYTLARGGNTLITADTTNFVFRPNTSGGNYAFQNYAGSTNLFTIDGSGNTAQTGSFSLANGVRTFQIHQGTASPIAAQFWFGDSGSITAGGWKLGYYDSTGANLMFLLSGVAGLEFQPLGTATSTTNYGSLGALQFNSSTWNGSAAVTNTWKIIVDSTSTMYMQYNGTSMLGIGTGGAVTANADLYVNSGWVRTYNSTGWYNQTYGGGIYMTDSTWVRTYNNKSFYIGGTTLYGGSGSAHAYGALTVQGEKGSWGGINFVDASGNNLGTLMFANPTANASGYWGIYNRADNAWVWQLDASGNNTVAGSYYANSLSTLKTAIRPISFDSLDVIKRTDIVHFNYLTDDPDHKPRLGLIAEHAPHELTADDRTKHDLNASIAVLLDGTKRLTLMLEDERAYRKTLESRLSALEATLNLKHVV